MWFKVNAQEFDQIMHSLYLTISEYRKTEIAKLLAIRHYINGVIL